jgi:hypothetical protein
MLSKKLYDVALAIQNGNKDIASIVKATRASRDLIYSRTSELRKRGIVTGNNGEFAIAAGVDLESESLPTAEKRAPSAPAKTPTIKIIATMEKAIEALLEGVSQLSQFVHANTISAKERDEFKRLREQNELIKSIARGK